MTDRDRAAFNAGIRHAVSLAQIAAVTLEIRPDAAELHQRAAIEAPRGLADGLRTATGSKPAVSPQYLQWAEPDPPAVIEATTV